MAPSISKECFPKPHMCFNCNRKLHHGLTKPPEAGKAFKRCAGCHVVTYCDKDCQAEHWNKVHKKHCKFLSGKKVVEGTKHVENSCSLCSQERESSLRDLASCNSPKTNCHVERVIKCTKTTLGELYEFHGEGKTCSCMAQFGCELPFPLGEITGVYLGFGLDEMLAHALKILNAMKIKLGRDNYRLEEKIEDCFLSVVVMRTYNWDNILIGGDELKGKTTTSKLKALLDDLKTSFGSSNAWLDTLSFAVSVIIHLTNIQSLMSYNSKSLEDPRFTNLRLMQEFSQSQLKLCQEEKWVMKLKLWPTVILGSMVILAPEEIHCGNCQALLTGPICVKLSPEKNDPRPILMPYFGGLAASCPVAGGQLCRIICMMRNTHFRGQVEKGLREKIDEETQLLINEIRYCDMCLTASLSSHRCSRCYAAQYCSTQCQHQDLAFHMTVCDAWAKDKGRKLIGGKKQVEINATRLEEQYKNLKV